jgi:hypothetical protein
MISGLTATFAETFEIFQHSSLYTPKVRVIQRKQFNFGVVGTGSGAWERTE